MRDGTSRSSRPLQQIPRMNAKLSIFLAGALMALTSCGGDKPEAGGGDATLQFLVWPETGSTVFSKSPVYVGDPAKEATIDGTIAIVVGGTAPKAGDAMPEGALKFEAGKTFGEVEMPVGKQSLHVHLFDKDGKATDKGQTVEYTVEATPENLGVMWNEPKDGATVKSPFKVSFGLAGAELSPAGQNALDKTLGHHHITVNKGVITPGIVMPMGQDGLLHYGKAQTEAEVTLEPGSYELTMQFADAAHRSYGKALAKTIKITVE